MNKSNSTKKALIFSVVSILACCMVLVGATFAWFSATVTNSGNRITAGTLAIKLYEVTGENQPTDISEVSPLPLFELLNWEPGRTVEKNLRIANEGTIDVKYAVRVKNLTESKQGVTLADDIDVYVNGTGAFILSDFASGEFALLSGELIADPEGSYADLNIELKYNSFATIQGGDLNFDIEVYATQASATMYFPLSPLASGR